MKRFADRFEAGRRLARLLQPHHGREDAVVLGLARGGVPVAWAIARELELALDVFVVRKLGVPGQEELAMGAIASGGVRVLNETVIASLGLGAPAIEQAARREWPELERRERAYRGGRPPAAVAGRTAIVVDDGLATGSSMRAAVRALRRRAADRVVVAVAVAPARAVAALEQEADEVVCAHTPRWFRSVGTWYADFEQTSDEEVRRLLGGCGRPEVR